jgi:hypothetical protein
MSKPMRDDASYAREVERAGVMLGKLRGSWHEWLDVDGCKVANIALKRTGPGTWLCVVSMYRTEGNTWLVCFSSGLTPGDALLAFVQQLSEGSVKWKPDRFGGDRRLSEWLVTL